MDPKINEAVKKLKKIEPLRSSDKFIACYIKGRQSGIILSEDDSQVLIDIIKTMGRNPTLRKMMIKAIFP